jgi:hypothetical protein
MPGDHFAAPGLHLLQYQPGLILTALLAGATYVHLTAEQVEKEPRLLHEFPLKAIALSGELRDILLRVSEIKISTWQLWFKSIAEPPAWQRWEKLVEKLGIAQVPQRNILYHAAAGGSLLFSAKSKKLANRALYPTPGTAWKLLDVNNSGQEAHDNFGLFASSQCEDDKTPLGGILLAHYQEAWLYAGTLQPTRDGRSMPRQEILAALEGLPFAPQRDLISLASGEETRTSQHILLVFVGARSEEEIVTRSREWTVAIQAAIARRLGTEFLPDRIEFYALYAREEKEVVDHRWCESQYLSGLLHRKNNHRVYRLLTALRSMV